MLGKVFKAYDIRGTYPDPLDEKMAWQIGYGISRYLLSDASAAGETSPMMSATSSATSGRSTPAVNVALPVNGMVGLLCLVVLVGQVHSG